jgi:lipopolysaccharide biosynthesis regulator YciM
MEHLADSPAPDLVKPANAISADQWTKAVDRAAGWTQARQQGVTVNVANIVPPSDAERAERKAVHAQLDAITKALQAP